MMGDEDDNKSQDGIWGKWQTIVAILTLCAAVLAYSYNANNQAQQAAATAAQVAGENAVTLQNHTSEISQLQNSVSNEQVLLYAINAQLTGLTQKIDDMQQSGHK
jgi:uncharacterized protein HemX